MLFNTYDDKKNENFTKKLIFVISLQFIRLEYFMEE